MDYKTYVIIKSPNYNEILTLENIEKNFIKLKNAKIIECVPIINLLNDNPFNEEVKNNIEIDKSICFLHVLNSEMTISFFRPTILEEESFLDMYPKILTKILETKLNRKEDIKNISYALLEYNNFLNNLNLVNKR